MIIYGFLDYAFLSGNRDWRGAKSTIDKYVSSNRIPEYMHQHNTGHAKSPSQILIRYAEYMLGLHPNTIKWPFQYVQQEELKLKASKQGIFEPGYYGADADNANIGKSVPPFKNPDARIAYVDMSLVSQHIDFSDIVTNKNHKAYLLIVIACCMAFGDRLMFEAAKSPELIPSDYNELRMYKTILRSTKLGFQGQPTRSTRLDAYMNASTWDMAPVFVNAYHNLTTTHPNLHLDDSSKLAAAANQFIKNMRLVNR